MSRFERAAWVWYSNTISPLTFEAGLLPRELDRLGLGEAQERIFKKAINAIRQFILRIQAADAKRD